MLESRSDSRVFKSALVPKQYSTPALGKYTTVSIVSWALAESVAIYGLLLFLLGGSFKDLYLFVAVALAVMIYYRPKMSELVELASAMKDTPDTHLVWWESQSVYITIYPASRFLLPGRLKGSWDKSPILWINIR